MTSFGIGKILPFLEQKSFFNGFQNALTPSYFSNIHLHHNAINKTLLILYRESGCEEKGCRYQFLGSILMPVKKQAVMGSPISGMSIFGWRSTKLVGGSFGMGLPVDFLSTRRSGLASLMVATRLHNTQCQRRQCSERCSYLSSLPSHQQGTVMRVNPFSLAKRCLVSSLALNSSRG